MDDVQPLATVQDLASYLGETLADDDAKANLYIDIASGMVRDTLHSHLSAVTGDVVLLDPINGGYVELPELPVSNVTELETFDGTSWTVQDPSTYTVSTRIGMIAGKPGLGIRWPTDPGTWRVTYSHGFTTIPATIVGVVLGVAARGYASPVAVDSERVGAGYQVKYSAAVDFTPIERAALNRYRQPRVA